MKGRFTMSTSSTLSPRFSEVSHREMKSVEGGALPLLGKIAVRVAAKGIIYAYDRLTR